MSLTSCIFTFPPGVNFCVSVVDARCLCHVCSHKAIFSDWLQSVSHGTTQSLCVGAMWPCALLQELWRISNLPELIAENTFMNSHALPSMSSPAMSTPAISSFHVQSCYVHPCDSVFQCPVLLCPSLWFSLPMSSPAMSNRFFPLSFNVQSCKFSPPVIPRK